MRPDKEGVIFHRFLPIAKKPLLSARFSPEGGVGVGPIRHDRAKKCQYLTGASQQYFTLFIIIELKFSNYGLLITFFKRL